MEFRNGLSYSAADRGEGLAIVGVADVSPGGRLPATGFERIRAPHNLPDAALLRPGDLLFVRSNGSRDLVGRCAEVGQLDQPTSHSGFTIRARVIDPEVNPKWVAAFFACGLGDVALGRGARGTNINNLRQERLQGISIPCPSRAIQDRLVARLSLFEDVISGLNAAVAARNKFQAALLSEVLRRGTAHCSSGSPCPEKRLDEVVSIDPESLEADTPAITLIRYIDISAVSKGVIDIPDDTVRFSEAPSRARRIVRQHDVLMSTVRPYLQSFAMVTCDASNLVASTGFAVLRPADHHDAAYVLAFLFSDLFGRQAHARLVGSNYPALTNHDVRSIKIAWPSTAVREKVAAAWNALQRESNTLRNLLSRVCEKRRAVTRKFFEGDDHWL
jgi:type I restriction enzyme S subunit